METTLLVPLERATSLVWKFFGFETSTDGRTEKKKRTEVVCKLCKKELKYTGGTSNLHFHLENHLLVLTVHIFNYLVKFCLFFRN